MKIGQAHIPSHAAAAGGSQGLFTAETRRRGDDKAAIAAGERASVLEGRSSSSTFAQRLFLSASPRLRGSPAFTLIEIMVVVGIMGIILTISIPFMYHTLHKDSMRKALADIQEIITDARRNAIEKGVIVELKIRPGDRSFSLSAGAAPENGTGSLAIDTEAAVEHHSGGGAIAGSVKLSDLILIDYIEVDLQPDLQQIEEVSAFFYPNGTSSALAMVLRSDRGEVRKLTTDVITGSLEIEVAR